MKNFVIVPQSDRPAFVIEADWFTTHNGHLYVWRARTDADADTVPDDNEEGVQVAEFVAGSWSAVFEGKIASQLSPGGRLVELVQK